jgi:hypothetical protein
VGCFQSICLGVRGDWLIDERIYPIDWSTQKGAEAKSSVGAQQSVCQEKWSSLLQIYKAVMVKA